jgi:branched-chain amino acid transport system permease protein
MGIMIVATVLAKNIQRTAAGRAFVAIRDNELAAEVSGIPVFRYKMLAFLIGCVFAGVSGWLWAYSQLRINPDQFRLMDSMWYLGMLVIGGWGSTTGVFFGVFSLSLLEIAITDYIAPPLADAIPSLAQQIRVSMSLVVNGLVIIIFIMLERRGLYYQWQKLKVFYRLYPYSGGRS